MAERSVKIDQKADLIWAIADKLTGVYKPHEYGEVILPLTVIRRFDCILADTKDAVLAKYEEVKKTLINNVIFYCYIDDFYAGGGEEIKKDALRRELSHLLEASLDLDLSQLLEEALDRTRIEMTGVEKKKYIREKLKSRLSLVIDDDGSVSLELKRK